MKILYLDFLYPKGHIRQNIEYIKCLSQFSEVGVLCIKGWYRNLPLKTEVLEKNIFRLKENKVSIRINSLMVMAQSSIIIRDKNPDIIFVSSYETISFALGRFFFRKRNKLFLLQHYNLDELDNAIKRWFFKTYMKKVDHIVFEDFIRDYLIDRFNLDKNRVHVLPHQLNENFIKKTSAKKYSCVGLSNSNDENMISEIVNMEMKYGIFKKNKRKVVLKSKITEFDNGYLLVFKGYLDEDKYNEYNSQCESIYMPFPATFRYRMSGTLVDALSNNKIVFGSDIPLMRYYSKKYPLSCKIVRGAKDVFNSILDLKNDDLSSEFETFKKEHSSIAILDQLYKMMGGHTVGK